MRQADLGARPIEGGRSAAALCSSFPGSEGSTALFDAHLARRTATGWTSEDLAPAKTSPGPPSNYTVEYDFSEDLAEAMLAVPLQQLAPGATPGMYNLFLRDEAGDYCQPEIEVLAHSVTDSIAKLRVAVPGPGRLIASGDGIARSVERLLEAKTATLAVSLRGRDRRLLAAHPGRRLRIDVRLRFVPRRGRTLSSHATVLMR